MGEVSMGYSSMREAPTGKARAGETEAAAAEPVGADAATEAAAYMEAARVSTESATTYVPAPKATTYVPASKAATTMPPSKCCRAGRNERESERNGCGQRDPVKREQHDRSPYVSPVDPGSDIHECVLVIFWLQI
jgi:hypothetical protein